MRYIAALALLMAALWLALSGVYKPLMLALGSVSVVVCVWLAHRMDVVGAEHNPGLFSWRLPVYWAWLVGQIVLANLQVVRLIFSPQRISPTVIEVPVPHRSTVSQATYANSVTLTPGTLSLKLQPQTLSVHALSQDAARELARGEMADQVRWLEGDR